MVTKEAVVRLVIQPSHVHVQRFCGAKCMYILLCIQICILTAFAAGTHYSMEAVKIYISKLQVIVAAMLSVICPELFLYKNSQRRKLCFKSTGP